MLYASLKAIHLLAVIAWVGGMFFMLMCLRPAVHEVLEAPARVRLMHATLRRFLRIVALAALAVLVSGAAMIVLVWRDRAAAGLAFNMPLDWYAMVVLFFVMLAVFLHVRLRAVPARRRGRWRPRPGPTAGAALGAIRWEVAINLVIGIFIVVMVRLGASA